VKNVKGRDFFTDEDVKEFLNNAPKIIRKAFNMVFEKRKEIVEKGRQLREEINRGARKGKAEPIP